MDAVVELVAQIAVAIVAVLAVPLGGYLVALARRAAARFNVQLTVEREEQLRSVAAAAVAKVMEYSRQQIRRTGEGLPSGVKLTTAIASVLEKLPNVSREEAEAAIHSTLPYVRQAIEEGGNALGGAIRTPEPRPESTPEAPAVPMGLDDPSRPIV